MIVIGAILSIIVLGIVLLLCIGVGQNINKNEDNCVGTVIGIIIFVILILLLKS